MIRRSYLILSLVAALGVGAAFAQTAESQKDRQKEKGKDQSDLRYKQKARAQADSEIGAQPFASLPMMIGDGSYLGVFLEEVTPERVKRAWAGRRSAGRLYEGC